jgi:Mce-associated membrane protein
MRVSTQGANVADDEAAEDAAELQEPEPVRFTLIAGLVLVLVLGGLAGWLAYRADQSRQLDRQRQTFLSVARQGATDLTTLNYQHVDDDVQRILDTATGTFYDDFEKRAPSFADVVKKLKTTSVGTVTETALEPGDSATAAHVLVLIVVKSQIAGQPEQQPRALRMRMEVQKIDDDTKVSDVEYVQ